MRKALIALLAPLALFAAPVRAAPSDVAHMVPTVAEGKIVTWADLDAGQAGKMTVWVWLPPGYNAKGRARFPVLYMHDGQNLFDRRLTNYDKAWQVDRAITRLAGRGDLRQWIVVGVQSPANRYRSLFPARLLPLLPDFLKARVTRLEGDGATGDTPFAGDAYLDFLVRRVKARVDRQFRTLPGREDTAVMGSSMGGLMALYAISEYPEVFGQAAAVSIHLPLAAPEGGGLVPEQAAKAVADAYDRYFATSRMRPGQNRLYLDHGTATLDAYYAPYFAAFDAMMGKRGWTGASYESRAFPGAEHDELAWAARLDIPLAFLDRADP